MTDTIATPKLKIAVMTITIDRVEGPSELCTKTTYTTWADAEDRIRRICLSAPKDGCYFKISFELVFTDLEQYEGRYDAAHPESKAYEGTLAKHIRGHLEFYAGLKRPAHIPEEDYDRILKEHSKPTSEYLAFLTTYALEDLPVTTATPASTERRTLTGNTYPAKGFIAMLGGKWDPNTKTWSVPAENFQKAQEAVDRFNPPPKAAPTVNPQQVPRGTGTVVATTPPKPAPTPAARTPKPKARKEPKLPPTALERRLEALLAGAKAVHDSIDPVSMPGFRADLDFAARHIQEALDRLTKGT